MNETGPGGTDARRAPLRAVLTIVLALALVAGLVWLAVGIAARAGDPAASQRQQDRDAVMLRAREYVAAAWNYGTSDLDDDQVLTSYRERVTPLITTTFRTEFEKSAPVLDQLVAEQGFARQTTVDHLGVESIDADSAQVIVNGEITESQEENSVRPTPFFWLLDLEKVDGTWLVADLDGYQGEGR
ncbi:hypothetical protein [Nocardioides donggukensis]|uniref:Mce-associated membrane protein n=1 Tax=Nocardioides donggukensis TaxID=2774019 RepID=A0A927Q2V0_9ACTN|nr:hypothetical protein [Nocardioides donggukensis]MBD8870734.1 hypothetical protein [Nocardioides donggukensis]